MRRFLDVPALRRASVIVTAAVFVGALFALSGCKSKDAANTESAGAVSATGTVQAPLPGETTTSIEPTAPAGSATSAAAPKPAAAIWPAKVGKFAKAVKYPVWYPATLPKGYKLENIDIVELDKGTGLICDIVMLNGDKALLFTQGSPKERSYPIVSTQKVPWGTETASVMHVDPEDSASPLVIVYSKGGTFIELQGDPSLAELKQIAASMVLVK